MSEHQTVHRDVSVRALENAAVAADEEDHEVWYNITAELRTYAEKITIATLLICTGCPRSNELILRMVTLSLETP